MALQTRFLSSSGSQGPWRGFSHSWATGPQFAACILAFFTKLSEPGTCSAGVRGRVNH